MKVEEKSGVSLCRTDFGGTYVDFGDMTLAVTPIRGESEGPKQYEVAVTNTLGKGPAQSIEVTSFTCNTPLLDGASSGNVCAYPTEADRRISVPRSLPPCETQAVVSMVHDKLSAANLSLVDRK